MKLLRNILYLHNSDLLKFGFSSDTVSKFESIRDPEKSNQFLYDYDRIANRSKLSREKLPAKEQLIAHLLANKQAEKQSDKDFHIDQLPEKWSFYYEVKDEHYYKKELNNTTLTDLGTKAKDMAICMAIMRFLHAYTKKALIKEELGLDSREELIKGIAQHLKEMKLYNMPASYDNVRVRYYEYVKAIEGVHLDGKIDPRAVMISKRIGNKNSEVYGEEHRDIFLEQYLHPGHKLTIETAYANYVDIVTKELALSPMSVSSVKNILAENIVKAHIALCRNGRGYYETQYRPFVMRKPPNDSFSLLAGDGWQPGTRVKYMFKDQKTGNTFPQIGLMSVWLWYDCASDAIVSYDISPNENTAQVRNSLRHVLNMHGIAPLSVIVDKKYEEDKDLNLIFTRLGVKVQNKRAYNPKSNPAERKNKEMNRLHKNADEYWIDRTPGVKIENLNNDDVQRGAPIMEEINFRAMIHDIVNVWNNQPTKKFNGLSRLEKMAEIISADAVKPDHFQIIEAFAQTTIATVKAGTFKVTIAGQEYQYFVPDWNEFMKLDIKNNKIRVYYDEKFMETVDIYAFESKDSLQNDRHLYTCESVDKISQAQVEMDSKGWKNLNKMMDRGHHLDELLEEQRQKRQQTINSLQLDHLTVKGVTQARHKAARASEGASLYNNFYEDLEHEAGRRTPIKVEVPKKTTMSPAEKLAKLKKTISFEG